jgi:hypothetical protein
LTQHHNDRKKGFALLCQDVFLVSGTIRRWHNLKHPAFNEHLEAVGQNIAGDAQAGNELTEPAHAVEGVSNYQQCPPVSHDVNRPANGAR